MRSNWCWYPPEDRATDSQFVNFSTGGHFKTAFVQKSDIPSCLRGRGTFPHPIRPASCMFYMGKMSYHPLYDSVAVASLSIVSLAFTKPSSAQRVGCLALLSLLTWHCVLTCPTYISRSSWAASVGGYTLGLLFHYVDVGVLSGWNFEQQGPARNLAKGPLTRNAKI